MQSPDFAFVMTSVPLSSSQCLQVWDMLAWEGRHTQSPVVVAAKPHYFAELDLTKTVQHLMRSCPHFWRSEELDRALQSGSLALLDPAYFSKV